MATISLATSLNSAGLAHARKLIKAGRVSQSASWDGPSPEAENLYIEREGWEDFGDWFLGHNTEANAETKGRYRYPFTDNFRTVSLNGLRAIRTRSAQTGEEDIFDAAGGLMDSARAKVEARSLRAWTFQVGPQGVNREARVINDISIISVGEAKGHGILITQNTLRDAATKLLDRKLPAYITHRNAMGDRLLDEVGFFSGFYLDGERIRARVFQAFESFEKFQTERFERLFEMAENMPDNFGVSLVFEGNLIWETTAGPVEYAGMSSRPGDALNELPSVQMVDIQSADFVDNPAANTSLFSNPLNEKNPNQMNTETPTTDVIELEGDGSASAELEKRLAAEGNDEAIPAKEEAQPEPEEAKKKTRKKKQLDAAPLEVLEDAEAPEASADGDPIELAFAEYKTRVEERDRVIADMSTELTKARAEVARLAELIAGADPVEEDCAPDEALEVDTEVTKQALVTEYLETHAGATRAIALIEVYKANKQLFNQTTTHQNN